MSRSYFVLEFYLIVTLAQEKNNRIDEESYRSKKQKILKRERETTCAKACATYIPKGKNPKIEMDQASIADRLLLSQRVRRRGAELLRRASIRSHVAAGRNARASLPAVCLSLAARIEGEPLDKTSLEACIRCSGAGRAVFKTT